MRFAITFLLFLSVSLIFKVEGQTKRLKLKPFKLEVLSDTLAETSGLTLIGDRLFSINDSGNTSDIFEIEKGKSQIKNTYKTKLRNIDWEAISSDSLNFYVGDFGNNLGTRKDLSIYKIPFVKDRIILDSIKNIPFYYNDQTDFSPRNINHNYDAEAMILYKGAVHLFSKEWKSKKVTRYIIDPNINDKQAVKPLETYDIGYSVTDATYHNGQLYLVGYNKKTQVFLTVFKEEQDGFFFKQPAKKYILGSAMAIGQIEGIASNDKGLFISGEFFNYKLGKIKQTLYYLPYDKIE